MTFEVLQKIARTWDGGGETFDRMLRDHAIPFISCSMIAALSFCRARYYLEYVERRTLDPEPVYFVKGRVFHDAAARAYSALRDGLEINRGDVFSVLDTLNPDDEKTATHLENAIQLMLETMEEDGEIIAVEQPFVMAVDDDLPIFAGIIDLISRQGNNYRVIDHKTGNAFYEPDDFQMAVYAEFVRREYRPASLKAVFHQYRWVNNLSRIRKPAFQKVEVCVTPETWCDARGRIEAACRIMDALNEGRGVRRTGECFMCPRQDDCNYR